MGETRIFQQLFILVDSPRPGGAAIRRGSSIGGIEDVELLQRRLLLVEPVVFHQADIRIV